MTATQPDLFSITNEAIGRAGENADERWTRDARSAIRTVAFKGVEFTTDAVWELLDKVSSARTHEPRAMGALMREAQRAGLIRTTGAYIKSSRPDCHLRPCAVWVLNDR